MVKTEGLATLKILFHCNVTEGEKQVLATLQKCTIFNNTSGRNFAEQMAPK